MNRLSHNIYFVKDFLQIVFYIEESLRNFHKEVQEAQEEHNKFMDEACESRRRLANSLNSETLKLEQQLETAERSGWNIEIIQFLKERIEELKKEAKTFEEMSKKPFS